MRPAARDLQTATTGVLADIANVPAWAPADHLLVAMTGLTTSLNTLAGLAETWSQKGGAAREAAMVGQLDDVNVQITALDNARMASPEVTGLCSGTVWGW